MSQVEQETQQRRPSVGPDALVRTLMAGVASAAAAYGAHKALTRSTESSSDRQPEDNDEGTEPENSDEEDEDDEELDDEGQDDEPGSRGDDDDDAKPESSGLPANTSKLKSVGSSASLALVPIAEHAAESAGRYLAENAPNVVRKTIVPRFIDAFEKAS